MNAAQQVAFCGLVYLGVALVTAVFTIWLRDKLKDPSDIVAPLACLAFSGFMSALYLVIYVVEVLRIAYAS
jgi:hypothetical protein